MLGMSDTTPKAVLWMLVYAALNPAKQARLVKEIEKTLGEYARV